MIYENRIFILQYTTIVLSVVLFCMSVAEVYIKACRKDRYYDYSYHYNYKYDDYNITTRCYSNVSFGVGIWCSILVSKQYKVV